jgi:flagellar biosynthesis/type III secretory pathway protein FliH
VDERFIPLAAFVRGNARSAIAPAPDAAPAAESEPAAPGATPGVLDFAHADVVHELALMRLAAMEAYERAVESLLRSLADDVLARELALAPADVDALVRRVLATFPVRDPVALRVSAADAARVQAGLALSVDPALGRGDLVVVVRDGALESCFAQRFEDALARAAGRM